VEIYFRRNFERLGASMMQGGAIARSRKTITIKNAPIILLSLSANRRMQCKQDRSSTVGWLSHVGERDTAKVAGGCGIINLEDLRTAG